MSQESSPNSVEDLQQEMDTSAAATKSVLKVEDNNQKMLDELFNLNSDSHLNCKPLKERGLPSSFWKTDSNSKQLCRQLLSSKQNTFSLDKVSPFPQSSGTTPFPGANPSQNTHFKSRNYPTVSHTRSRSSPATCYSHTSLRQHPLAEQEFHLQQQQQQQQQQLHSQAQHPQQHLQMGNWDPDPQSGLMEQMTVKRQHQAVFPFNISEFPTNTSTQGEVDFRGFSHPHSLPQLQQQLSTGYPARHTRAHSNVDQLSLPLPKGWEKGVTPEGEAFYIDHNTRSTSWTHPALHQVGGFFPQQGIGSPQHRPSCFQPGELSTIREMQQQQHLLSRMNLSDEPFYSHSHQGSQDSGIGIIGADHTVESVQTGDDFLLTKLDSSQLVPHIMSQEQIPFPGTNSTMTEDHFLVDTPEVSEFQLHFQSTSPTHYDVSKLQASISTEMLLDAVSAVDPINPQNQP